MVDYILTRGVQVLDKAHVVEMVEHGGTSDLPTMLSDHLPVACTVEVAKSIRRRS
jgi:endonuclease/exonuclease/phosphatase family metal-dependent hydrolase